MGQGQTLCSSPPHCTAEEITREGTAPEGAPLVVVVDTDSGACESTAVIVSQAEGHPSVRVFELPQSGLKFVDQVPSNSHGYLHEHNGPFCLVTVGTVKGWVGAKNVRMMPTSPAVQPEMRRSVSKESGADIKSPPKIKRNSSGFTDSSLAGSPHIFESETPSSFIAATTSFSTACPSGTKCRQRSEEHLSQQAHPFDPEYAALCKANGLAPEEPSLTGLFQWVDSDNSGKISRKELESALPQLTKLFGETVTLSDKSWERLDEDGNGCVNFSEFSCWAGPRLGLPLGVAHLFQGKAVDEVHGCAILGCPCEGFHAREQQVDKIVRQQSNKDQFKKMLSRELKHSPTSAFMESNRGKERTQLCKCGHKFAAHQVADAPTGEIPYPMYWDRRDSSKGHFTDLVPMVDQHALELFQDLVDSTYSPVYTRDRKKHNPANTKVPKGFNVVRVFRSENSRIWDEYGVKRAQLLNDVDEALFRQYDDVLSSIAWVAHGGTLSERLKPEINEWYVFHGSSAEAAEKICKLDFRLQYCGKSTGSLYGRGIYLAESATKADEYSKPNAKGEYAMVLCRVVGGHAKYTAEVEPDPEELVRSCIEGPYDCIIGDRRKTRGTYREFVLYDSENVYAEYIIHYTRQY